MVKGYSVTSRTIHWVSALIIFGLFGLGLYMMSLSYYDEFYRTGPWIHKSIGILFAMLLFIRIAMLPWTKKPAPLAEHKSWEKILAKGTHVVLYCLMVLLVISGYLISTADGRPIEVFNWFNVPALPWAIENQEDIAGELHEWFAYLIIGLAVLHAAGAVKHHLIDKDNTLTRMTKGE